MRVGILGAGQLGRMLALSCVPLGIDSVFFDPGEGEAVKGIGTHLRSAFDDRAALADFARQVDVVTFEFENVPVSTATELNSIRPVFPQPESLRISQDRLVEKNFLRECGIATAPFLEINSRSDLVAGLTRFGQGILKTRRLGYDGKGQFRLNSVAEAESLQIEFGNGDFILEGFVSFERELSIVCARSREGEIRFYPAIENTHRDGILRRSTPLVASSLHSMQAQAEDFARRIVEKLGYVGIFTLELFQTSEGLVANEMAPRVHNSGHWTIEGAECSQFENHIRAVCGLPLGSTNVIGLSSMFNVIGKNPDTAAVLEIDGARFHTYGKAEKPGRKLGHITVCAPDQDELSKRIAKLESIFKAQSEW